ncbi:MAG TPA: type II secretion system protein [Candidatus Saccharimonadales bacterium]|nr:type II secretion system protein [Candidatus Saccharimonadales bacterium]
MGNKLNKFQKGFTLIEILVVIGILSILLAIVLIAINPQQQFQQANNTQRSSDVSAILNAISSYAAQNNGDLPAGIAATAKTLGKPTAADIVDLCSALVPTYIADLPMDPTTGTVTGGDTPCATATTAYDTGYTVQTSAGNRVTVSAPDAQGGETISITR